MAAVTNLARYKNKNEISIGVWWSGHMLCEKAAETQSYNDFVIAYGYIESLREKFPCDDCREHINDFCDADSPSKFKPIIVGGIITKEHDANGLALWIHTL